MKMKMKKMMAVLLVLAMCAGMWNLPGVVNATESQSVGTGAEEDPMQTGTLTLKSNSASTGDAYLCLYATNAMAFNWGDYLVPVSGKGGLLHNGVYMSTSIYAITETNGFYFRIGPDAGMSDVAVGDEIKFFGEFTISLSAGDNKDNVGKFVKITPTVVKCTKAEWNEAQTKWLTTWELVSSEEETTSEESYLSVSDFGSSTSWAGNVTLALNDSSEDNAAGTNTIFGKTFIAHMSATKTSDETAYEGVFYGTTSSWNGICVKMKGIGENRNTVSVHISSLGGDDIGTVVELTDAEMAAGDWVQIDLSEKDENEYCYLTVTYGEYTLVENYYFDASALKDRIHQRADVSDIVISFNNVTALDRANKILDNAPEITAIDFGIEDGGLDSEQTGNLGYSLDGKKMVFTLTRGTTDSDIRVYYGGSSWFQLRTDNDILHYYRNSTTYIAQHTQATNLDPVKLEVYMEYADLDDDGYKDDAKLFVRRDGTKFGVIFQESYFDEDKVWMEDIDALYAINDTLTMKPNSGTATVTSVNTHATATLTDGVLTISGEGNIVPSVVSGVVTDETVAATVTEIQIGDGITGVVSGVFSGYTNLKSVTYADTVTSVSDTAFTDCATGVKVVSPEGYAFDGGLVDAVHVGSFTFTELDIDRSEKTEAGLTLELETSTVIRGTAKEGNLTATTYSGLQAEIDGVTTSVTFTKTSYGTLACEIPADALSSEDAYTIVIKSGVMEDNDEDMTICVGLKADFTVYVNAAGLSGTGYVTDHGVVTLQSRTEGAGQREVYFNVTGDTFPYGDCGDGTWVPLEPIDEQSGIFLNGKKINCTLKKGYQTVYYLHLGGSSYTYRVGNTVIEQAAQEGDYLTVYGKFRYQDHIVEFEPFTYRSLGGSGSESWEVVEATDNVISFGEEIIDLDKTGVGYTVLEGLADAVVTSGDTTETFTGNTALYLPGDYTVTRTIDGVNYQNSVVLYHQGDVNTDDVLDVKDLVAMKKYQNAPDDYGKAAGQAATSVGTEASVREMLVATTVSKDGTELPTELVGQQLGKGEITWADDSEPETYITSVNVTDNGTTVFGMADANNNYSSSVEQMAAFDDYGYDYIIDLNATRDFKILQLTDTQIIERVNGRDIIVDDKVTGNRSASTSTYETRDYMDKLLTGYMDQIVKESASDLILLTGDNIMGEFDDAGTELQNLIDKMDSYGILWAPVFGNHDNESLKGVTEQCQMFNDSKYCLFNRRHEIGGNGNYSIGLAQNGTIKRSVFMMDTNYTGLAVLTSYSHYREYPELEQLNNCAYPGFTYIQTDWYRDIALRVNTVAGKTIPSLLAYHIPTKDLYDAEVAAGYITEDNDVYYTITDENRAQPGDSGVKGQTNAKNHTNVSLLEYMNEVGTDGAFFGHEHRNNTSIFYANVRWTYGVKTGGYDSHNENQVGGTLITLSSDDYATFTITPTMYDCPTLDEDECTCSSRH